MGKNANKRKNQNQQRGSTSIETGEAKHNPWANTVLAVKNMRGQQQADDLMMKDMEGAKMKEGLRGGLTKGAVGQIVLGLVALGALGAFVASILH